MSQHFFGTWNGAVSDEWLDRAERVAAEHDANVVRFDDPAAGPRGWMSCHHQGEPFNTRTANATLDHLEDAGLWDGGPALAAPGSVHRGVRVTPRGNRSATLTLPPGHVLHDGPDPEAPQVREFTAVDGDTILLEILPDWTGDTEACRHLGRTGDTVSVGKHEQVADVVEREYRAAYRAAKAAERTDGLSHRRPSGDRAGAADLARRTLRNSHPPRSR